jgi:hypothetical protein
VRAALQLQTPASRPRSTACVWAADKKAVFSFVGAQRFVVVVGPWMSRRASTATRVRPGPTSPAPPRVREIGRETVFQNSAFSEKFSHRFSRLFKKIEKIIENQKNSAKMQLTCERNRKILELRNSVELTKSSVEFADNSAKFFKNSATKYQPV